MSQCRKFGYMENGKFLIGWRHRYMSRGDRERFFAKYKKQHGKALR